jgi:hypothetical protein
VIEGNNQEKDSLVLMNGTYKIYNKRGIIVTEEVYKNGIIQTLKIYNGKGNVAIEEFDFTRTYKNEPNTYYIIGRNNDGSINMECFWRKAGTIWVYPKK